MAVLIGRHVAVKRNAMFISRIGESSNLGRRRNVRAMASAACPALTEEYYNLLRLEHGASEKDVKRAYRRLALQYHPDVCKGDNCGATFLKINEAYKTVMSNLVEENEEEEYYATDMKDYPDNYYTDMNDQWEEWMGWEGACPSRDYSNHINYYS